MLSTSSLRWSFTQCQCRQPHGRVAVGGTGGAARRFCKWRANYCRLWGFVLLSVDGSCCAKAVCWSALHLLLLFLLLCRVNLPCLCLVLTCLTNDLLLTSSESPPLFSILIFAELCSSCCGNVVAADCHWGACVAFQFDRLVRCWVTGATTLLNKSTKISAAAI